MFFALSLENPRSKLIAYFYLIELFAIIQRLAKNSPSPEVNEFTIEQSSTKLSYIFLRWLVVIFTFGALFFLYMTYLGVGIVKFVKAEISVDQNGITVADNEIINKYLWNQIDRVKNSKRLQIYTVYDKTGQTVFTVDHFIPGFDELKSYIENRITI